MDNVGLLQSIVRLTENADVREFDLALIATVDGLVSNGKSSVFRFRETREASGSKLVVQVSPAGTAKEGLQARAVALDGDPALAECFRTGQVVAATAPGSPARVVHPLKTSSGIVGFLVLRCDQDDPRDRQLISALLAFYKNYVSLLNDSQRDALTGLHNRKTFHERMLRIIGSLHHVAAEGPEDRNGYCLGILDIDRFKTINDTFGHLYGDEVLLLFTRAMAESFRGSDLLFRFGGEEFIAVLKGVDLDQATAVFERFRETIAKMRFSQVDSITVSAGLSMISGRDLPSTVMDRADQALYFAKNSGRNRVCAYEALLAEGKVKGPPTAGEVELF